MEMPLLAFLFRKWALWDLSLPELNVD